MKNVLGVIGFFLFFVIPVQSTWACNQIYGHIGVDSRSDESITSFGANNVALLQYNFILDAWVSVATWYDPEAVFIQPQSSDYLWSSSSGGSDVLLVPGGSQGTYSSGLSSARLRSDSDSGFRRESKGPLEFIAVCSEQEPPATLENIAIGFAGTIFRQWLNTVGTAIAILRNPVPGGGSPAGESSDNPIQVHGEVECSVSVIDRQREVTAQYARTRIQGLNARRCFSQVHMNKYYEFFFPDGRKGVYRGAYHCPATTMFTEVEDPGC